MNTSGRKEMIAPTLVLFLICLVITAALAEPIRSQNPNHDEINLKMPTFARGECLGRKRCLPLANNYQKVLEVYEADNKAGYVITAQDKGFGGKMTVMVGVNDLGEITGVKVTAHGETPGLGTKAMTVDYLAQYQGEVAVTRTNESDKTQIDAVTGATVSSNAIFRAVEASLAQFEKIGGGR